MEKEQLKTAKSDETSMEAISFRLSRTENNLLNEVSRLVNVVHKLAPIPEPEDRAPKRGVIADPDGFISKFNQDLDLIEERIDALRYIIYRLEEII